MKKHLANIFTCLRIIGSIALLFLSLQSRVFYIIYLFCGFSDMIDGTIARRLNTVSSFGSKLDTIADFVFMTVSASKLLHTMNVSVWLWIWIAGIAIIKVINIVLGFVYKKKLVDLHTILNKITGFLLFLLPLTLRFIQTTYSLVVVCTIATIAAIQEGYYTIKSTQEFVEFSAS